MHISLSLQRSIIIKKKRDKSKTSTNIPTKCQGGGRIFPYRFLARFTYFRRLRIERDEYQ